MAQKKQRIRSVKWSTVEKKHKNCKQKRAKVVTRSGNALASINVVALRQTRLVLGWVTVCGRVNHFSM